MLNILPYDEFKFHKNVILEDIVKTSDDSEFRYNVTVDLIYPISKKEKTKEIPLGLKHRFPPKNVFS